MDIDDLRFTKDGLRTPFDADCARCGGEISTVLFAAGHTVEAMCFPMYVCPECGNKRCPKAAWHELPCGHSNEPGQPGSNYPLITPEKRAAGFEALKLALQEAAE